MLRAFSAIFSNFPFSFDNSHSVSVMTGVTVKAAVIAIIRITAMDFFFIKSLPSPPAKLSGYFFIPYLIHSLHLSELFAGPRNIIFSEKISDRQSFQ